MIESLSYAIAEKLKADLLEATNAAVVNTLNFINEVSYAIALFGGGTAIMMKVAGSERAMKYFWGIEISYIFIKGVLGEFL